MDFLIANISNTSGARAIDSTGERLTLPGGEGDQCRIFNIGPNAVCILDGDGTQSAAFPTSNATPNGKGTVLASGATEVFTLKASATDLHAICLAGQTATIYVGRNKGA